jgi:hypothetical protein
LPCAEPLILRTAKRSVSPPFPCSFSRTVGGIFVVASVSETGSLEKDGRLLRRAEGGWRRREGSHVSILRSDEQRSTWSGFVRGVFLVVFIAQTDLKAEDPKPAQSAPAKMGEAVNIMWRFDGSGRFPNIHPPSEWRRDKNIFWKPPLRSAAILRRSSPGTRSS